MPAWDAGSIPACTGEPSSFVPSVRLSFKRGSIPACTGEPLGRSITRWGEWRSIPACTGEPDLGYATRSKGTDRSIPACTGEPLTGPVGLHEGLSPRVRGNL